MRGPFGALFQMRFVLLSLGLVALLYGLHRIAVYAEQSGWLYYRTRPPRMRSLGLLEELSDPSVGYRIEEQASEAIRADQEESGDVEDDVGPNDPLTSVTR